MGRSGELIGMTLEEAIKRFNNNAEYERTHGNLQGCLEFRQLAEWLEKLQKVEQVLNNWKEMGYNENDGLYTLISEVVEDGKND